MDSDASKAFDSKTHNRRLNIVLCFIERGQFRRLAPSRFGTGSKRWNGLMP